MTILDGSRRVFARVVPPVQRLPARLATECRDLLTFFLLPLPALLLPWRLAWPFYWRVAARRGVFSNQTERALAQARNSLQNPPDAEWARRFRSVLIVDLVDFWFSLLCPWRLRWRIRARGAWPTRGPVVIIGSHWGPGFGALRSMRWAGIRPHFIFRKTPSERFRGQRVRQLFVTLRLRHQKRLFPGKCYHPGGYPRRLLRALRRDEHILVLADVPAGPHDDAAVIEVFGRPAVISTGMLGLTVRAGASFVTYAQGLDVATGDRDLRIDCLRQSASRRELLEALAGFLEETLERDPAQWQLWFAAAQFFERRPPPGALDVTRSRRDAGDSS